MCVLRVAGAGEWWGGAASREDRDCDADTTMRRLRQLQVCVVNHV